MTALALTIILTILWIGGIAIGYWHGGWRQVVVLAAVLLSYAVVSEWAAPNGHDLSRQFHWGLARTTAAVGLLYLIGGTLLIGGLGSFALPRPSPLMLRERILGAVVGLLNGGLLLALVLRTLRSYAFLPGSGQVLQRSALSRFLIEGIGYVLIAALALGVIAAIVGLFFARRQVDVEAPVVDWPRPRAVSVPPQPHYADARPAPAPVMASNPPPPPLVAPVAPEPVFATAPIIDWPSGPPPGRHEEPAVALTPIVAPPPVPVGATLSAATRPNEATHPNASSLLPTEPVLPRRVEPPMLYPIAPLLAAQMRPATTNVPTPMPPAASAAPAPASPPGPETPRMASVAPPPARARPTTPPPGALQPAFVPPNLPRPSAPPPTLRAPEPAPAPLPAIAAQRSDETATPDVQARDAATDDAPRPVVRELEAATEDAPPPVVREVEVTTRDVPTVATPPAPPPASVQAAVSPATEGESMQTPNLAPVPKANETAPLPTIGPPPLPSAPPPPLPGIPDAPSPGTALPPVSDQSASPLETSRPRAGFVRVAVARQSGGPAEQPPSAPQPPQQPEPLQPPLPTGPRVHPCPVCGYPIRDHARYCPNCGSRQRM